MTTIAVRLEKAANAFEKSEGANIFEDLFGNFLDYEKTNDYRAVFEDGSMLVLCGNVWEANMFSEDQQH